MPATRSTTLLPGLLDRLADYRRLRQAVTQGKSPLALSGLAAVHRTHFTAALRQDTKRPLVLVCPDDAEARQAARERKKLRDAAKKEAAPAAGAKPSRAPAEKPADEE